MGAGKGTSKGKRGHVLTEPLHMRNNKVRSCALVQVVLPVVFVVVCDGVQRLHVIICVYVYVLYMCM